MSAPRPGSLAYVTMAFPAPSETFQSRDVAAFAARGLTVSVHALRPPLPRADTLVAERGLGGVAITAAGPRTALGALRGFAAAPAAAARLLLRLLTLPAPRRLYLRSLALYPRALEIVGELAERRPDVVHLAWAHYPSLVGYLVQRALPGSVVSVSFSAYDIDQNHPLTAEVARRADVVRTLAEANVADVARRYGLPATAIAVVPDGIDPAAFGDGSDGGAVERVRGRVATAGRLTRAKGVDATLRAFARACEGRPGATLDVLGDGPARPELERLADELGIAAAVRFCGHVSQEQVARALRQAEVFLFLSRSERLPNVVKEAMAAGCACVTTATFAMDELLPDASLGVVVAIDDVASAAAATARLLDAPAERTAMAAAARERIGERFAIDASIPRYLQLWGAALERRAPSARATASATVPHRGSA